MINLVGRRSLITSSWWGLLLLLLLGGSLLLGDTLLYGKQSGEMLETLQLSQSVLTKQKASLTDDEWNSIQPKKRSKHLDTELGK